MQPPLSLLLRIIVSTLISVSTIGQAIARADVAVVVATSDGEKVTGVLEGIEPTQIRVVTESGVRTLGVESVRRVECIRSEPDADGEITIFGTDGARLTGTDVEWEGDVVSLTVPTGVLTMPVTGVEVIEWNRTSRDEGDTAPGWRESLPDEMDSDVIVVTKGDGMQCVPCAIVGITSDAVRIRLDGDAISVKRDRVAGLRWLREPTVPGGILVTVAGGQLPATRVEWSPEGLVINGAVTFPAPSLRGVDYAAGRIARLAELTTERLTVDPFFGGLAKVDGLVSAFQPRVVVADDGSLGKDLVIRPRTVAVWRVPPGSRTFATMIAPAEASGSGALVVISVDDTEVFRGSVDDGPIVDGAGIPIGEIPMGGARRLSITVDYGRAGPIGGSVILRDPHFTK